MCANRNHDELFLDWEKPKKTSEPKKIVFLARGERERFIEHSGRFVMFALLPLCPNIDTMLSVSRSPSSLQSTRLSLHHYQLIRTPWRSAYIAFQWYPSASEKNNIYANEFEQPRFQGDKENLQLRSKETTERDSSPTAYFDREIWTHDTGSPIFNLLEREQKYVPPLFLC